VGDQVDTGSAATSRRVYRTMHETTGKMRGMSNPWIVRDGNDGVGYVSVPAAGQHDRGGEA
jgi:hypothetical protein